MPDAKINRYGFWITHRTDDGLRTYAAQDDDGLAAVVEHITGRHIDTFATDNRGFPKIEKVTISGGLHIYGGGEHKEPKEPKTLSAGFDDGARICLVDFDPHFSIDQDEQPDEYHQVWLRDAEGCPLLRCDPEHAEVIAVALEYALADIEKIYGVGWGNLADDEVAALLTRHQGEHPHVADAADFVEGLVTKDRRHND